MCYTLTEYCPVDLFTSYITYNSLDFHCRGQQNILLVCFLGIPCLWEAGCFPVEFLYLQPFPLFPTFGIVRRALASGEGNGLCKEDKASGCRGVWDSGGDGDGGSCSPSG